MLAQRAGPLYAPRHARQDPRCANGLGAGHRQRPGLDDGGARERSPQPLAFPADPSRVVDPGELAREQRRHYAARSFNAISPWPSTASATSVDVASAPARTW